MTREEASKILQGLKMLSETERCEVALDMAISALSENKGDLISRQAVLNQIFYSTDNSGDVVLGSALRHRIENLPSVENKGEWIEKEVSLDGDIAYECSKCGELFCLIDGTPADNLYNFCPNCGADMRGET